MLRDTLYRVGVAILLLLVLAACEGGFTSSGSLESSRVTEGGGLVAKSVRSAHDSITDEIDVDGSGDRLHTQVTLQVEEGTFAIELLAADDNVTLSLEAIPGNLASGQG